MREIKFRAWDKKEKKMYTSYAHQGVNKRLYVAWLKDKSDDVDLELMQFTGVKDKNGKDIYEGDLIVDKYTVKEDAYPVIFRDGCFIADDEDSECLAGRADMDVEIIGNIYEITYHLPTPIKNKASQEEERKK